MTGVMAMMTGNATQNVTRDIVRTNLQLYLDASNSLSYPGTGTTWTDLSGNAKHFTLYKGQTTSSSINIGPTYTLNNNNKYGLGFRSGGTYSDAVNDAQWLSGPISILQTYTSGTISCWLKTQAKTRSVDYRDTNITTAHCITSRQKNGAYSYGIFSIGAYCTSSGQPAAGDAGRLYWHGQNGVTQAASTNTLTDDVIYYVTVTWSGTNCKFYINGILDSTTNGNYSIPADSGGSPTPPLGYGPTIGVWPASGENYLQFSGVIHLIKMYNIQLTDAQVAGNYNVHKTNFGL